MSTRNKIASSQVVLPSKDIVDLQTQNQLRGFKNLIINGDFRVNQRGQTTYTTVNDGYGVDMWSMWRNSVTATHTLGSETIDGKTRNTYTVTATSSGTGYIGTRQLIELDSIPKGEILTFSCYVKTNSAYTVIRQNNFGGSADNISSAIPNDEQWHFVTAQVDTTGTASDSSVALITYDGGTLVPVTTGDYISIADVQLEQGTQATEFERRPYGLEETLCKWFFRRLNFADVNDTVCTAFAYSTTDCRGVVTFEKMRSQPIISTSPASTFSALRVGLTSAGTATGVTIPFTSDDSFVISLSGLSGFTAGNATIIRSLGSAYIDLTAEIT